MPSENYRYYCLDGSGHLHGTEWISGASDEDAVAQVQAKHPDGKFEIWQGQRLVAQLGFAMKDDCIGQSHRSIDDSRVLRETGSILARPRPDSFGELVRTFLPIRARCPQWHGLRRRAVRERKSA